MTDRPYNVLFLCTANSARSILGEALLNAMGEGRFKAYSAGSRPGGRVNPFALEILEKNRIATEGARSKSWDEFAAPGAPVMDFVFTVCDSAAAESCPVWPGHPMSAHWGIADPAAAEGDDDAKRRAFLEAYTAMQRRIARLVNLPFASLDQQALKQQLVDIGKST
jgi:arsenate reductase